MSEVIVPDGWEIKQVSSLCKVLDNLRVPLNDEERQNMKGHIPYYGANTIVDYINDYIFDEDLILLAEDGGNFDEYEKKPIAFKISGKSWINNHAHVLKPNSNVEFDYLFYSLEHKNITSYIRGGTRSKLNQSDLKTVEVLIPKEKKEQEKIAKILSTLDKNIENTNKIIEKEKNIKKALMQELLTNGIDQNNKIRSPKTHTYKQSKLGLIPEEWEVDFIENHTEIITGNKDTQDRLDDGIYPFYVRSQTIERINTYSFDGEAVLTAGDGVGVGKVFHHINEKFDFHQRVYCIHDFSSKLDSKFFFEYFRTYFINQVNKYSAKGSVDSVRYDMIALMNIPLPLITEQKQIAKILSTQDKKIESEQKNLSKLQELKKGLMSDLLSGDVRVKV